MKNKYYRHSHLSEQKFREIIRYFAQDLTAETGAKLVNLSYKAVREIYNKLRRNIHKKVSSTVMGW